MSSLFAPASYTRRICAGLGLWLGLSALLAACQTPAPSTPASAAPSATATPVATPSPTAQPTETPSPMPTATPTPTASPSSVPTPQATLLPTPTPRPSNTPVPRPSTTPSPTNSGVNIFDWGFSPMSIKIKAGTSVTWLNLVQGFLTLHSQDKLFADAPLVARGTSFKHTFATPGTYTITINAHTHRMTITVEP